MLVCIEMSDDGLSREQLDEELWRLRSVEIDLEDVRNELETLKVNTQLTLNDNKELEDKRQILASALEAEKATLRKFERTIHDLEQERDRLKKERDWAIERLQTFEEADYMYNNYGFKVTDEMPKPAKKAGWRLSR